MIFWKLGKDQSFRRCHIWGYGTSSLLGTLLCGLRCFELVKKMTGGTPEVRSDKILTLMTFNIQHSTNGPMDQRTNGPMYQ